MGHISFCAQPLYVVIFSERDILLILLSTLSPTLRFLMCENDLHNVPDIWLTIMFANDTSMCINGDDLKLWKHSLNES